jgi:hypothetical protein
MNSEHKVYWENNLCSCPTVCTSKRKLHRNCTLSDDCQKSKPENREVWTRMCHVTDSTLKWKLQSKYLTTVRRQAYARASDICSLHQKTNQWSSTTSEHVRGRQDVRLASSLCAVHYSGMSEVNEKNNGWYLAKPGWLI